MDREFLSYLNPIFRIKDVNIIWSGTVYKIGQMNNLHPRNLVIASPGIFLIRKKQFNFQSRIITSISFFDLISLHVTEQEVSFSSKQSQIRIKSQNTKDIVSLVVFIRQAQFPTDVLPLNFTFVNEEVANLFTPSQLPYQPISLFLDRTLSCILHFDLNPTDALLTEIPTQFFRKYIIQKEMLQTPLLPAWILSLSYDRDIETLRFESLKLSDFLNQSKYLFRYNKFVKTIEFDNVDFTNSEKFLSILFRQPHCFKPINWHFINCNIINHNFNNFFNSLSFIDKKIAEVHFSNCTFSEDVFLDIFQSIFFNECFHSIQCFQFNSNKIQSESNPKIYDIFISQVSEILCCSWVLQQKCLKKISLNSIGVDDMTPILSQILTFDTGLKFISLEDNNFNAPLKIEEDSPPMLISFISFRKSRLSKSFISSFVSLVKREKVVLVGIDLSQVEVVDDGEKSDKKEDLNDENCEGQNQGQIEVENDQEAQKQNSVEDDENGLDAVKTEIPIENNSEYSKSENHLEFLLNQLQSVSMPALEVLFFDGNLMNVPTTIQFIDFLRKQTNLANLSINCSIDIQNSPFGLQSFIGYCSSHTILSLSICGDSAHSIGFSYGLMNLSLIRQIRSIECLDISNQKVGQEGLELLLPLVINGKLKEIYFDGSNVNSFQFLTRFCTTLLSSKIKYASFPEKDFQRILSFNKNPNSISLLSVQENDDDFVASYQNLKNQFHSHFYFSEYNCSATIRNKALKRKEHRLPNRLISEVNDNMLSMKKTDEVSSSGNTSSRYNADNNNDIKIIENCIFNHKIHDLYNECVENSNVELSETMCSLMNTIQDSLSFDYLLNSL